MKLYIFMTDHYSDVQRNDTERHETVWMKFENLNERSLTLKMSN